MKEFQLPGRPVKAEDWNQYIIDYDDYLPVVLNDDELFDYKREWRFAISSAKHAARGTDGWADAYRAMINKQQRVYSVIDDVLGKFYFFTFSFFNLLTNLLDALTMGDGGLGKQTPQGTQSLQ